MILFSLQKYSFQSVLQKKHLSKLISYKNRITLFLNEGQILSILQGNVLNWLNLGMRMILVRKLLQGIQVFRVSPWPWWPLGNAMGMASILTIMHGGCSYFTSKLWLIIWRDMLKVIVAACFPSDNKCVRNC